MSRLGKLGHGLYTGQVSYDFVGRWRRWIALSGIVIIISIAGLGVLLAAVLEGGSIRHAAQSLGCSYRYVWGSLRRCAETLGEPLII